MAYTLTQEDIDQLVKKGFDMNGVAAGTEAMAGEMEALMPDIVAKNIGSKISSDAGAPFVSPTQAQYGATKALNQAAEDGLEEITMEPRVEPPASVPMAPMDEAPMATMPSAAPAAAASPMMGLISPNMYGAPISADPFENLSKNQRMMLAFAAIKDAGAALQGGEGNAFNKTLEGFAARQDMERKRQAQVAQIQARQQVLGALGAGSLPANATPDQIDAHIAKLTGILASSPEMAPYVTAEIARLNPMRERASQQANQITSTMAGVAAVDALMNSPDLGAITGFKGTVNEFLAEYGAAPQYSNLMSYVDQLQGLNFLEAYQSLKGGGPITDIEGKQATAARTRINSALKGRPEDLMVALQEAKDLFQQALEKNPQYKGAQVPQGLSEDDLKYLKD
jgi:hypothetical protein